MQETNKRQPLADKIEAVNVVRTGSMVLRRPGHEGTRNGLRVAMTIRFAAGEKTPDGREQATRDGDNGLVFADPFLKGMKARRPIGPVNGSPGADN